MGKNLSVDRPPTELGPVSARPSVFFYGNLQVLAAVRTRLKVQNWNSSSKKKLCPPFPVRNNAAIFFPKKFLTERATKAAFLQVLASYLTRDRATMSSAISFRIKSVSTYDWSIYKVFTRGWHLRVRRRTFLISRITALLDNRTLCRRFFLSPRNFVPVIFATYYTAVCWWLFQYTTGIAWQIRFWCSIWILPSQIFSEIFPRKVQFTRVHWDRNEKMQAKKM